MKVRETLGIPLDALVIGFVGRFTKDKGIGELATAFEALSRRFENAYLLMVGDYEEGDPVSDTAKVMLSNHPKVAVAGVVSNTVPYYHAMDILALPTYREGFPTVCLEAAAAGKPIVTTRATGAIDSVLENKTGLRVSVGDADALQLALSSLLESAALREQMGENATRFVRQHFHSTIVWQNTAHFYRSIHASRPNTSRLLSDEQDSLVSSQ
jgi:glycosyltransferase involved in cell wall biosynthesis